ncbi:LysR substrate binding domain protein [compost metagenome]
MQGHIDVGFDCDRPYSPDIAYKLIVDEPILAVATKEFIKTHKKQIAAGQYLDLPHLLCERLHPDKILSRSENQLLVEARFNDIATTRAVCTQGLGWALLPAYAIKKELNAGTLVQIDQKAYGKSKYGVWWLRSRPHLKDVSENLIRWLHTQEL